MDVPAPNVLKTPVKIPYKTLMGPGPSNCSPRVLHAISGPVLGHMHPEVFQVMDEIKEGLRYVFQTRNDLTLAISASGHSGMEAIFSNLLESGDVALVAVTGIWGNRAADIANRYGVHVREIHAPLGETFNFGQIEAALQQYRPKLFFIVQGESSTGIYQPLDGLGNICERYDCLLAVDTVASLGGVPFFMDRWKIDVVYTGSQKILGAPPGLTPISFSTKAQKAIFSRKSPSVYYWDMKLLGQQWNCFNNVRPYHHTTCSNLLFALREGLAQIAEEGVENVNKRHAACAKQLYNGIEKLGLKCYIYDEDKRLPSVTTILVPEEVNWREICAYAMKNYNVEISGGLGPTVGKVFRIGLMGYNATPENVELTLAVLGEALEYVKRSNSSKL